MARRAFILVSIALVAMVPVIGIEGDETGFNLSKTQEYLELLQGRPSFPDSTTFAYYYTYSITALGGEISMENKKRILEFLKDNQAAGGGLTGGGSVQPTTLDTYFGIKTLALLDSLDEIERESIIDFTRSCQNSDGGFGLKPGSKSRLLYTYYSLETLYLFEGLDDIDLEKAVSFVLKYYNPDGGFSNYEGGLSMPKLTFAGVVALKLAGNEGRINKDNTVDFLKNSRYLKETNTTFSKSMTPEDVMYALATLDVLGSVDEVNKSYALNYLSSVYVPENGGFGPRLYYGTTPPSTYHAVRSLAHLGVLKKPKESKAARYPKETGATQGGICGPTSLLIISMSLIAFRLFFK